MSKIVDAYLASATPTERAAHEEVSATRARLQRLAALPTPAACYGSPGLLPISAGGHLAWEGPGRVVNYGSAPIPILPAPAEGVTERSAPRPYMTLEVAPPLGRDGDSTGPSFYAETDELPTGERVVTVSFGSTSATWTPSTAIAVAHGLLATAHAQGSAE